ncbi:hypothetical protein FSW04_22030 [Baekduia soli]|uniref:Uncharacterized protein n=1 Tax=Baekduia soli TaxID=496014 RepID=A0A5B8UBH9_9ACTN|nr:hypothetical protein [Baekduia soli]QEC49981.1 hypothetical protein FSW04_22030 [Baekduia soli]
MTVTPDAEDPRELAEGESDAVTVAFSDATADVCGVARIGRARSGGEIVTSGLAMLFAGGGPVAVRAEGGTEPDAETTSWGGIEAAGLETEIVEPLRAWRVHFADADGRHGFSLDLSALSEPAVLEAGLPASRLGGMEGYDQLVHVSGSVVVDGQTRRFTGRGQRGHSWGTPDWDKLALARTIGVWLEDGRGVTMTTVRPAKAASHAEEAIHAVLLAPPGEDDDEHVGGGAAVALGGAVATVIADPRLSTTYDAEGRQRHAGLELYVGADDDHAHRAAGEAACGTTLDLGRLRLDCAFFTWRMEGQSGVGRYDVLRRVADGAAA